MKIAYLINRYPAVSHTFIRREILALERQGHEILRVSIRGWDDEQRGSENVIEQGRTRYLLRGGALPLLAAFFRVLASNTSGLFRALNLLWKVGLRAERPMPVHLIYLFEACRLSIWLRSEKIEHLHAHFGTNSAEVAMLTRELGGPPWSLTVHGSEEFDKANFIALPEKIRRASFVVGVSSFGRSQLWRHVSHRYWNKIHVVHCGLEKSYGKDAGANCGPRRLVCVGRLCEQKGQLLLIEAAWLLTNRGIKFELVLAGDGEMRNHIEGLVARYSLQDVVQITGWLSGDEVRAEILAARAMVLPSFAEGLPVVLLEAMALRRPIISTYVGGIPELVEPGEHGWLVPAGDVEALALAMECCLVASAETIDGMGERGRQRVLQRHDADKEAAKLTELFAAHGERKLH